jgi:hypothetical protein
MSISEIYDLMWFAVIGAAFLWALYAAHTRENCAETPGLDARPSAADAIPSRAEMLSQLMEQTDR